MEKEKRGRPARQKVVENYERQKAILLKQGYREKAEIISVVRANVMVVVTSLPLGMAGLFVWKVFGCLFPGMVLGIGIYAVAFITGSAVLLWLSILNILGAGGDIWIAWRVRKYHTGYVLDHPTECGFVIFQKQDLDNA